MSDPRVSIALAALSEDEMHVISPTGQAPRLARRTPSSYAVVAGTPADLVKWLTAQPGVKSLDPKSPHELARLRCPDDGLIIVYRSHSVLCQGQQLAAHRIVMNLIGLPEAIQEVLI